MRVLRTRPRFPLRACKSQFGTSSKVLHIRQRFPLRACNSQFGTTSSRVLHTRPRFPLRACNSQFGTTSSRVLHTRPRFPLGACAVQAGVPAETLVRPAALRVAADGGLGHAGDLRGVSQHGPVVHHGHGSLQVQPPVVLVPVKARPWNGGSHHRHRPSKGSWNAGSHHRHRPSTGSWNTGSHHRHHPSKASRSSSHGHILRAWKVKGGLGFLMSSPCLKSQGFQFEPSFLYAPLLFFYVVLLLFLSYPFCF